MPPKKEGGASKKKKVNMEKNGHNPGQKKTPLANNTSQTKSPIASLILEVAKLTKMQAILNLIRRFQALAKLSLSDRNKVFARDNRQYKMF
ncbi:unnamed protein product [Rotaria socialis]|uniref:Uncharacterized protein n=1 Tax=Rotaria socialis TaxID=392032 RepID=A0A821ERX5_9BILA|nr:unnamed protein product [Rotaria socialis]